MSITEQLSLFPRKKFVRLCLFILWSIPLVILIFIATNTFHDIIPPPEEAIDIKNTKIIQYTNEIHVHTSDVIKHNLAIISVLEASMAMDNAQIVSRETVNMQLRLIYVSIVTALASFFFRKPKDPQIAVGVIILIFIFTIYGLEVHHVDLYKRYNSTFDIKGIALQSLLNYPPTNIKWYEVNSDSMDQQMKIASKITNRLPRKFLTACRPDLEQIVFYFFPWFTIYILGSWNKYRRLTRRSS